MQPAEPEPGCKRFKQSHNASEAARTRTACNRCRDRKIKCSGSHPCRYCTKQGTPCEFPEHEKKKLYSVTYVEALEKEASQGRGDITSRATSSQQRLDGPEVERSGHLQTENELPEQENAVFTLADTTRDSSQASPIVPDPIMSSSQRFGSHIKELAIEAARSQSSPAVSRLEELDDNVYNVVGKPFSETPRDKSLQWPTQEAAHVLLDTFLGSLGAVQHLIDSRAFSDRLAMFYEKADTASHDDLWDVELLLVLAIGELLTGMPQEMPGLPGTKYFQEALERIPSSFNSLRTAGTLAIEIMGLTAFYLQCADCKDDAYLYAGMGLRLAMTMGMARGTKAVVRLRSDRTHQNRLWWTIYMQERRLAAATGNPFGVCDELISTSLPQDSPGFPSASTLNFNIGVARITGDIIQALYSPQNNSEKRFILQVSKILSDLSDLQSRMPIHHKIDFVEEIRISSRTSATLYLMLLQAKMLTTRPIILHAARMVLTKDGVGPNHETNAPFDKFCSLCIEDACDTLRVLQALRTQNLLSKFGFFDLDAVFSATFVLILACRTHLNSPETKKWLPIAISLLEFLRESGNKVADKRLADIQQMCSYLEVSLEDSTNQMLAMPGVTANSQRANSSALHSLQEVAEAPASQEPQAQIMREGDIEFDIFSLTEGDLDGLQPWDTSMFTLNGTIEVDWGEFERVTSQFHKMQNGFQELYTMTPPNNNLQITDVAVGTASPQLHLNTSAVMYIDSILTTPEHHYCQKKAQIEGVVDLAVEEFYRLREDMTNVFRQHPVNLDIIADLVFLAHEVHSCTITRVNRHLQELKESFAAHREAELASIMDRHPTRLCFIVHKRLTTRLDEALEKVIQHQRLIFLDEGNTIDSYW
ncbi:Proline utilization trans-activator [Paramyrothecium foliicola]|nr:Proline utilization trans-activator [Paramyrothecium foliicola]